MTLIPDISMNCQVKCAIELQFQPKMPQNSAYFAFLGFSSQKCDGMLKSPRKGKLTSFHCYCWITVCQEMIPCIQEWTYWQKVLCAQPDACELIGYLCSKVRLLHERFNQELHVMLCWMSLWPVPVRQVPMPHTGLPPWDTAFSTWRNTGRQAGLLNAPGL